MKKAIWNGKVIAESENTVNIEGNDYFPADSIKSEFFEESETNTLFVLGKVPHPTIT